MLCICNGAMVKESPSIINEYYEMEVGARGGGDAHRLYRLGTFFRDAGTVPVSWLY